MIAVTISLSNKFSSISSGLISSSTSLKYALANGSLAKEGYASSKVLFYYQILLKYHKIRMELIENFPFN